MRSPQETGIASHKLEINTLLRKLNAPNLRHFLLAGGSLSACLLLCSCSRVPGGSLGSNDPNFQVDVLHQEAAVPGRVVRATQGGKELLSYTCKEDDAAVVMFTMRDLVHGANVSTKLLSAKDQSKHQYLAEVVSQADVKLLVLKRGFAVRPKSVTIELGNGNPQSQIKSTIQVTAIAEPKRVVAAVSPARVAVEESRIQAYADDSSGVIELRGKRSQLPTEYDRATFLGLSFSPWDHGERGSLRSLPILYERSTDWVKVRVDRYRTSSLDTTLVCHGLKLVQVNGKKMIQVPERQLVGKIRDQNVFLEPTLTPVSGAMPALTDAGAQTLVIRFNVGAAVRRTSAPGQRRRNGPPVTIRSIDPSVRLLGIERLKLAIDDTGRERADEPEMAWTFTSRPRGRSISEGPIGEFKIMITTTTVTRITSDIFVLPVHHEDMFDRSTRAAAASWPLNLPNPTSSEKKALTESIHA